MRYQLRHVTRYRYADAVTLCHNEARMFPRPEDGQTVHHCTITVSPEPATLAERDDYFGNRCAYFEVSEPHRELEVTVTSEVTTTSRFEQLDLATGVPWEDVRAQLREVDNQRAAQYLLPSRLVPLVDGLRAYAEPSFPPGRPFLEAAQELNHRIHSDFTYDPRATTVSTPLATVLANRAGVCQDFAHFAIGCLRALELPAAYVSGYLETLPPPGRPKLRGVDASHAWFSVFVPGQGWFDLDPTNDKAPDERYVVVARGRDYGDLPPLRGVIFGGGPSTLEVSVDVHGVQDGGGPGHGSQQQVQGAGTAQQTGGPQ